MTEHAILAASTLKGWRKSSHSNSDGGSCVEVLDNHRLGIPVRDSKEPHGPAVIFPKDAWSFFISAIKAGKLPT